ncbi:MAG: right-handed parallel beta-helix repeat-containing protein, partial [Desulfatitalea sp.]
VMVFLAACGGSGGGSSSGGSSSSSGSSGSIGSSSSGGGGTLPDDETGPINDPVSYQWDPNNFTHLYEVGPGRDYADPNEVPWESLAPSTLVRIYYRDTPYRTKWVINVTATADAPVVVLGVASDGHRPMITGEDATTRQALDYWNENRSVIKIGGSSIPDNDAGPAYIYVQGLDIRCARPAYSFTDDSGQVSTFSDNAAAIHVEAGDAIFIQDCILHDAGNGLFSGAASSRLTISGNYIYDNGIDASIYEHNSYTESQGIIFQYNHYGPLRSGCLGNNLKDRSSGTIIRCNWIEGGNRQLDLVETDYDYIASDPDYDATFVYGNVLIEPEGAGNSQILHYGGDGGNEAMYRRGTLYFYHNTVVSTRGENTTLLRLSTTDVQAQVFNNILFVTATGDHMAITSGNGQTTLFGNWLPSEWRLTHESDLEPGASVTDAGNVEGVNPGFVDLGTQDFHLAQDAEAGNAAAALPTAVDTHPVEYQYLKHQQYETRPTDGTVDIGAFEIYP